MIRLISLNGPDQPHPGGHPPTPLLMGPVALFKFSAGPSVPAWATLDMCLSPAQPQPCVHLAMDPADLHPDPWTDFLAWPWTCPTTADFFGDLDSCLTLHATPGSAPLCLVAVGQSPSQWRCLSCCPCWHAWCLAPRPFREQPAVVAPWQSFWRLTDTVLLL